MHIQANKQAPHTLVLLTGPVLCLPVFFCCLQVCEKALADYMESKRRAFPRFYFVSTADLLDILSNGNNPVKVMQHMSKCFQAIGKLKLDTETPAPGQRPRGLGMISCVGEEYVPFKTPLPLVDKVCVPAFELQAACRLGAVCAHKATALAHNCTCLHHNRHPPTCRWKST